MTDRVSSLALNEDEDVVIIGTVGKGVMVAQFNQEKRQFDSITNITTPNIPHLVIDEVAVHKPSGMVAIASRGGLSIGELNGGGLTILNLIL